MPKPKQVEPYVQIITQTFDAVAEATERETGKKCARFDDLDDFVRERVMDSTKGILQAMSSLARRGTAG